MKVTKKQIETKEKEDVHLQNLHGLMGWPIQQSKENPAIPIEQQFLEDFAPLVKKYEIGFSYDTYNSRWRIVFNYNSQFKSLMQLSDLQNEVNKIRNTK